MEDAVSSARMMVRAASVMEEGETGSKRAEEGTPIWARDMWPCRSVAPMAGVVGMDGWIRIALVESGVAGHRVIPPNIPTR